MPIIAVVAFSGDIPRIFPFFVANPVAVMCEQAKTLRERKSLFSC